MDQSCRTTWRAIALVFAAAATSQGYISFTMAQWWPWALALPFAVAAVLCWHASISDDRYYRER